MTFSSLKPGDKFYMDFGDGHSDAGLLPFVKLERVIFSKEHVAGDSVYRIKERKYNAVRLHDGKLLHIYNSTIVAKLLV